MNELTELLQPKHNKKEFSCGKPMLDNYIHTQAKQDVKRNLTACFVVNDQENQRIKAYYTLASASIPLKDLPAAIRKKLPKSYRSIPTTLLGRLAVDSRYQGQQLGKQILVDAMRRSSHLNEQIASFALVVDPLDDDAERFYEFFGFIKLPDSGKMFLSMTTVENLFR